MRSIWILNGMDRRGQPPVKDFEAVLDHLVHHGPAGDGVTCKQDHSVDGIDFKDYVKVIERIKEIALD